MPESDLVAGHRFPKRAYRQGTAAPDHASVPALGEALALAPRARTSSQAVASDAFSA